MKLPRSARFIIFSLFLSLILVFGASVFILIYQNSWAQAMTLAIIISVINFFYVFIVFVTLYILFNKSSVLSDNELISVFERMLQGDFSKRFLFNSNDEHYKLKAICNDLSDQFEMLYKNFNKKVNDQIGETQKNLNIVESQNEMLKDIKQELEKFKMAVKEAPIHIIMTDNEGKIIYANKASVKITGYSVEEMIGQNPKLWGQQMSKEYYLNLWKTIKQERRVFSGEVKNKRKDGTLYNAEIRISPVLNPDNEPVFYVGIEEDITERKLIDKIKDDFISTASHQLRTPITAIRWLVEEMIDHKESLSPKHQLIINNIYRSTLRMVGLIKALLNISRIQSGKLVVIPKEINISLLLDDAIRNINNRFADKNPNINFQADPNLKVICDPDLFSNIVENLITNAVKYSHPGSEVSVKVEKNENNQIVIEVVDYGIGIPEEDKNKIFSRFFRARNAQLSQEEGSGLGLFLTQQIVKELGGQIEFDSNLNKGSRFKIILPAEIKKNTSS